jgi:4-hydroxybenzoate polyprenyltransferase
MGEEPFQIIKVVIMQIAWIGLVIIIVSWFVQLLYNAKGKKEINPIFCILQAAGISLLVYGSFIAGDTVLAILNLLSAVMALVVLVSLYIKK